MMSLSADLVGAPLTYTCDATTGATARLLPVVANADQIVVINDGTATICIAFGGSDVSVTSTGAAQGYMILAKSKEVISVSNKLTHAAAVAKSGAGGDVQFQRAIGQ